MHDRLAYNRRTMAATAALFCGVVFAAVSAPGMTTPGMIIAPALNAKASVMLLEQQEAAPVSVDGRVLRSDGTAAADFVIRLLQPNAIGGRTGVEGGADKGSPAGEKSTGPRVWVDHNVVHFQGKMGRPVAQTTTDANGKFSFPSVKPGAYRITGGNAAAGLLIHDFTVEAGKPISGMDIKIRPPANPDGN